MRITYRYWPEYPATLSTPAEDESIEFLAIQLQNGDEWEEVGEDLSDEVKNRFESEIFEYLESRAEAMDEEREDHKYELWKERLRGEDI